MQKKKIILICVTISMIIAAFLTTILLLTNKSDNSDPPPQNVEYSEYYETINDITWLIKYNTTNNSIVSISASYHEFDKSSKYWEDYAYKHGDHNVYLDYDVTLLGIPQENDWFVIEKTETYSKDTEIFSTRTIRYEEKLKFSFLS